MNREYIDMHLAVDRYLRGALSDDETAEFEERLLWDQELIDEIDLAEKLSEGLASAAPKVGLANGGRRFGDLGSLDWVLAHLQKPVFAAFASAVLFSGMTSLLFINYGSNETTHQLDGLRTEILPLYATRGSSDTNIAVGDDTFNILLVDAPPGYSTFRVTVSRRGVEKGAVWTRTDIEPTYPDSLALGVPSEVLTAGKYILTIDGMAKGDSGHERVQRIPFVVTHNR